MFVEIEHQVVGDDGVAGGEERNQALDQMSFRRPELVSQVVDIQREVDFLHRPSVAHRIAVHLVERRIAHRSQREREAGIEQAGAHWQASQLSGFSSEHRTAAASPPAEPRVALAMRVAGRDLR